MEKLDEIMDIRGGGIAAGTGACAGQGWGGEAVFAVLPVVGVFFLHF